MVEYIGPRQTRVHDHDIICPECDARQTVRKCWMEGRHTCEGCGRTFSLSWSEDLRHRTAQLGLCQGCGHLVEIAPSGVVPRLHGSGLGRTCIGVSMQALRQSSRELRLLT